jgi:phosphopantothenoylcysteine decarboxylase/phosphopantothenate--cysteine ligase
MAAARGKAARPGDCARKARKAFSGKEKPSSPSSMPSLSGRRILLVIGGGIAAYKVLELIRRLSDRGAAVRPVMTAAAQQFVTPLAVAALARQKVHAELFSLTEEAEMGHIELSRAAELLVVAPATADLLAKMAAGLADDLASTLLLATDQRVLVAPAMNVRMWLHPATQRNVAQLRADGIAFVGPDEGAMACNEFGPGRLAEPAAILAAIERLLADDPAVGRPLAGRHVLVTSGPTFEPIDPVRVIANRSSGRQGHAIAAAAAAAGAAVTLVSGPVALPDPVGVTTVHVETAAEMLVAVEAALPAEAAIFTAAVADWRVEGAAGQKLKKAGGAPPTLRLVETADILATVARRKRERPRLVIGFAAETEDVVANARAKRERKGCDWIVANDVSAASGVLGGPNNSVHLVTEAGVEDWPALPKEEVARRLVARIAAALAPVAA